MRIVSSVINEDVEDIEDMLEDIQNLFSVESDVIRRSSIKVIIKVRNWTGRIRVSSRVFEVAVSRQLLALLFHLLDRPRVKGRPDYASQLSQTPVQRVHSVHSSDDDGWPQFTLSAPDSKRSRNEPMMLERKQAQSRDSSWLADCAA